MESIRSADPLYIGKPATALEAIKKFHTLRSLGKVNFDKLPELLQKLAKSLPQDEFEIFVNWLMNPTQQEAGELTDPFPSDGVFHCETEEKQHQ